ncbi:1-deoxy-D-xylulose-5-phosphate reductoisomerase [Inquilinus sp. CAU 1745]|uniref:1-deoxy-D-xylulose-5-phosphate reductoisomerase n=1 Tax=Inquilinus sp. CAU 1745 TaxID=3140369 RepID=UPI00325AA99F
MVVGLSHNSPRRVTVLGSTGSVGRSTVDLLSRNLEDFQVEALTANRNVDLLADQAKRLGARLAVVADESCYLALKQALSGTGIAVAAGPDAVIAAAERPADWVMSAIVGARGLAPTLAAARQGAMVAFANKECLVCAGPLLLEQVQRHGATLLPVDSEHNAIFQVLDARNRDSVDRLILTASGGPFRSRTFGEMAAVTPEEAVAHPTWDMGAKISVDSATMMNKGLEIIEASLLFGLPEDRIDVLVHPQSVVHSMVEYSDGSVLAQLGTPDMRIPIAHALAWPRRMATPSRRLGLADIGRLDFEPPDPERFPALRVAREALRRGGGAPTVLNAANEVAVEAFLAGGLRFLDIVGVVEHVMEALPTGEVADLDMVAAQDEEARRIALARVRDLR